MGDCLDLSRFALRPTYAVINLDVIERNLKIVAKSLSAGTDVIAVIKSNGYGHGATMVAESAMRAGAACLAVATIGEAGKLRDEGVTAPILVLGPTHPGEHETAVKLGLELAVGDLTAIESIQQAANRQHMQVKIHLKIDTGMHRFGADPRDALNLATVITESPGLRLAAIFTHYAESDALDETNALRQAELFDRTVASIKDAGIDVPMLHTANSAATLRSRRFDYDAIRLGIALYGIPSSADVPLLPGMKPALRLESTVARLFELRAGERISYGGTYEALRDERDALIPCGYGDGYRRALSNRGWASRGASVFPVHGRVCMDQMIVGVPDDADIALGDRVVLISDGEGESPTAVDLAEMLDTIPYEIVTGISARVPRVYVRDGDVVAIEDLSGLTRY